jgi:F-type H+-transporting ATPase subunit delta
MKDTIVASRYAKSLLDLAMEKGNLEQVKEDMKLILETCRNNRDFKAFIANPVIKSDKKIAVLNEIFGTKINELSGKFVALLARKKREKYLQNVAAEFLRQYNQHKQIMTAVVITASGLDDTMKQRVLKMVTDSTKWEVELVEKVNPALIGGFILEYGGKRIDTSISQKLNRLRREFKENPYIKNF